VTASRQGDLPRAIRILAPQVAAQIAAGEVILRPAAVVKELVENSLDAAARYVTVEIEEGGRRLLRVADDGWGMSPEEAALSLQRHATSKLRDEADLLNIHTLGFRGEALPSIAAVSRLTLITCPPGGAGYRLVVVAGELQESSPWAAAPGTQVSAAELFFNTPARRKFLKSKDAEQAHIVETMRHLALGYPEVHFTLKTPARVLLSAPAAQDLAARVATLHGPELAGRLLPVALAAGPWQVTGLISDPEFSLASSRFQVFLVNRRVVADRVLGAVLKATFAGLLPRGRHPVAVLHLSLPAPDLDVNVHPAKAEVRFQDPGRVYSFLLAALRQALGPLAGSGPPGYTVTLNPEAPPRVEEASLLPPVPSPAPPAWPTPPPWPPAPSPAAAPPSRPRAWRFQDLAVIGQLKNTYILAQAPEGLVLIDQHAAHERVLYESLKATEPAAARQALLFPRVVEVPIVQADWVREHLEVLAAVGLELSHFGGASFLIAATPAFLAGADLEAVVAEAVEVLSPLPGGASPQTVQEAARQFMACRGAIKAGEVLQAEAIRALLVQLDEIPVSSHCPHGRPLWRLIPLGEIHQSFRRPK
jgi:DNA mismatch repair protein MutL